MAPSVKSGHSCLPLAAGRGGGKGGGFRGGGAGAARVGLCSFSTVILFIIIT